VDRVLAAAEHDVATFEQFVQVAWLVDPPLSLLRPSIVRRAALAHRQVSEAFGHDRKHLCSDRGDLSNDTTIAEVVSLTVDWVAP
jgi:hypothetical protein